MRQGLILAGVAAALLTAGCAQTIAESRVRTALSEAGLSDGNAACMAERMVDRLSLLQLRRLSALGSLKDKHVTDLTLDQFFRKVRALKDPEILAVTTSSAAVCALR